MKPLTEYERVTQIVLFDNGVLAVFMSGRKYDVITQNVRTLVFRHKVRYQNASSLQNPIWKRPSSENVIRHWLKPFQATGSVLHRKGAGRPSTSQEVVDRIHEAWTSYVTRKARMLKLFTILQYCFYK
jgi:hypothetical protein